MSRIPFPVWQREQPVLGARRATPHRPVQPEQVAYQPIGDRSLLRHSGAQRRPLGVRLDQRKVLAELVLQAARGKCSSHCRRVTGTCPRAFCVMQRS